MPLMNPILGLMEMDLTFSDLLLILILGILFFRPKSYPMEHRMDLRRLERKVDLLLKNLGVELPPVISPEVQLMARDPRQKIAAIRLHREQHPGLGLAEAKADVEEFMERRP